MFESPLHIWNDFFWKLLREATIAVNCYQKPIVKYLQQFSYTSSYIQSLMNIVCAAVGLGMLITVIVYDQKS